jgi:hypothetical protein
MTDSVALHHATCVEVKPIHFNTRDAFVPEAIMYPDSRLWEDFSTKLEELISIVINHTLDLCCTPLIYVLNCAISQQP